MEMKGSILIMNKAGIHPKYLVQALNVIIAQAEEGYDTIELDVPGVYFPIRSESTYGEKRMTIRITDARIVEEDKDDNAHQETSGKDVEGDGEESTRMG